MSKIRIYPERIKYRKTQKTVRYEKRDPKANKKLSFEDFATLFVLVFGAGFLAAQLIRGLLSL